ncbi:hypothetical protein DVH24_030263, partial [Malus domestica]
SPGGRSLSESDFQLSSRGQGFNLLLCGVTKVNVDGAWNESSNLGGVGVIVRNDSGDFIAVTSVRITHDDQGWSVIGAAKGFQNFILECDSLKIVAALRDSSPFPFNVRIVVKDSRELMASITEVSYTHVRRQANGIAHRLARAAIRSESSRCWFKEPPDLILDLLIKESGL